MIRVPVIFTMALLLLLTACSRTEAGEPRAAEQRLSPPVPTPKDARGVEQCDALTADQISALGGDPASVEFQEDEFALGPACAWSAPDNRWAMSIAINSDPAVGGLETVYKNQQRGVLAIFEPFEIDGHPAVRAQQDTSPFCGIAIGLADTQLVSINMTRRDESVDTCEIARRAGSALLSNLPPLER